MRDPGRSGAFRWAWVQSPVSGWAGTHSESREVPGCAGQATSSTTDGAVSTCAGFLNALPLRSWITWQARSSSGRCADEGNTSLSSESRATASRLTGIGLVNKAARLFVVERFEGKRDRLTL